MTFGQKVLEILTWTHKTQKDIHILTGISRSTLSEYIRDSRSPTIENAQRIADALGVSLWTLLNGDPLAVKEMDLTEKERCMVGEYRLLTKEEHEFLDHAFRLLNHRKKL